MDDVHTQGLFPHDRFCSKHPNRHAFTTCQQYSSASAFAMEFETFQKQISHNIWSSVKMSKVSSVTDQLEPAWTSVNCWLKRSKVQCVKRSQTFGEALNSTPETTNPNHTNWVHKTMPWITRKRKLSTMSTMSEKGSLSTKYQKSTTKYQKFENMLYLQIHRPWSRSEMACSYAIITLHLKGC